MTEADLRERAIRRCTAITAASGSNFYLAFLPLPRPRREGIFCVYAYCRVLDDLVDEAPAGSDPRAALDEWRERAKRVAAGTLSPDEDAVAVGLAVTHERFGLREDDLLALIDGMEMDLAGARYATWGDLSLYCERVAGRVGCLCLPVFGSDGARSRAYALTLGRAFQLTNILRDVGRDAIEDRIYLPLEDLARFGVAEEDVLARRPSAALTALLRFEADRARALFERASLLLPDSERPRLYPATIMTAIYRRLLDELEASGFDVLERRVSVSKPVKALLALGVFLRDRALGTW